MTSSSSGGGASSPGVLRLGPGAAGGGGFSPFGGVDFVLLGSYSILAFSLAKSVIALLIWPSCANLVESNFLEAGSTHSASGFVS